MRAASSKKSEGMSRGVRKLLVSFEHDEDGRVVVECPAFPWLVSARTDRGAERRLDLSAPRSKLVLGQGGNIAPKFAQKNQRAIVQRPGAGLDELLNLGRVR